MIEKVNLVSKRYNFQEKTPIPILESNLERVFSFLKGRKKIMLDIETDGLDPFTNNIILVQIGSISTHFVIDMLDISKTDRLKLFKAISDKNILKIGQNLKFEYKFFRTKGNVELRNINDTMVRDKIIYNGYNYSSSLKELCQRYLNINLDIPTLFGDIQPKTVATSYSLFGNLTYPQIMYAVLDIVYPYYILKKQKKISKIKFDVFEAFSLVLGQIELNGLPFNKSRLETLKTALEEEKALLVIKFFKELHSVYSNKYGCIPDKEFKDLNLQSPKQIKDLFKDLGYNILTREGKESVGKEVINRLKSEKVVLADIYSKISKVNKSINSFTKTYLNNIHPITNRIHSEYYPYLKTLRLSSSNINVQQVPKDKKFRQLFEAEKGWMMAKIDYGSQEARVLADFANEKELIKLFTNGDGDYHSRTARIIFHKDKIEKSDRNKAKTVNFLIPYGGNYYKLSEGAGIPLEEAKKIIEQYFFTNKKIKQFLDKKIRYGLKYKSIPLDPITGAKYHFYHQFKLIDKIHNIEKYNSKNGTKIKPPFKDYTIRAQIKRACMNYSIQGPSAFITKLASIYAHRYIIDNNLQDFIKIVNLVHDEIVVQFKEEYENHIYKISELMEEASKFICSHLSIPADPEIRKHW